MPKTKTKASPLKLSAGLPGKWIVTIPGFHPTRVNQLITARHWAVAHRLKSRDKLRIYESLLRAGVPAATGKRRVGLTIVLGPRQRGGDVDAFWKSSLDSLVSCGALTDDNRTGVELMPVLYERGRGMGTVFTIEDMEVTS